MSLDTEGLRLFGTESARCGADDLFDGKRRDVVVCITFQNWGKTAFVYTMYPYLFCIVLGLLIFFQTSVFTPSALSYINNFYSKSFSFVHYFTFKTFSRHLAQWENARFPVGAPRWKRAVSVRSSWLNNVRCYLPYARWAGSPTPWKTLVIRNCQETQ